MQEWYVRFIHYGHEFQGLDGKRYVAIAMPEKDAKTLPVVTRENFRKWEILRAWRRNGVHRGSAEGVAAIKYYIAEIWREIYGEEGPIWLKK